MNMIAAGRVGTYIVHGVDTVSSSFHPFGGAVDIIVVEQEDGSFKTTPWYVKFGKFQGVLRREENRVAVAVNDGEPRFHMHLDNNGGAYFLKDMQGDEAPTLSLTQAASAGDESSHSDARGAREAGVGPEHGKDASKDGRGDGLELKRGSGARAEHGTDGSQDDKRDNLELESEGGENSRQLSQDERNTDAIEEDKLKATQPDFSRSGESRKGKIASLYSGVETSGAEADPENLEQIERNAIRAYYSGVEMSGAGADPEHLEQLERKVRRAVRGTDRGLQKDRRPKSARDFLSAAASASHSMPAPYFSDIDYTEHGVTRARKSASRNGMLVHCVLNLAVGRKPIDRSGIAVSLLAKTALASLNGVVSGQQALDAGNQSSIPQGQLKSAELDDTVSNALKPSEGVVGDSICDGWEIRKAQDLAGDLFFKVITGGPRSPAGSSCNDLVTMIPISSIATFSGPDTDVVGTAVSQPTLENSGLSDRLTDQVNTSTSAAESGHAIDLQPESGVDLNCQMDRLVNIVPSDANANGLKPIVKTDVTTPREDGGISAGPIVDSLDLKALKVNNMEQKEGDSDSGKTTSNQQAVRFESPITSPGSVRQRQAMQGSHCTGSVSTGIGSEGVKQVARVVESEDVEGSQQKVQDSFTKKSAQELGSVPGTSGTNVVENGSTLDSSEHGGERCPSHKDLSEVDNQETTRFRRDVSTYLGAIGDDKAQNPVKSAAADEAGKSSEMTDSIGVQGADGKTIPSSGDPQVLRVAKSLPNEGDSTLDSDVKRPSQGLSRHSDSALLSAPLTPDRSEVNSSSIPLTVGSEINVAAETENGSKSPRGRSKSETLDELESQKQRRAPGEEIEISLCRHLLKERMGAEAAAEAFASKKVTSDHLRNTGSEMDMDRLVVRVGTRYYPWVQAAPKGLGVLTFDPILVPPDDSAIVVAKPVLTIDGKRAASRLPRVGSVRWSLWPFGSSRRPQTPEKEKFTNLRSKDKMVKAASETDLTKGYFKMADSYLRPRTMKTNTPTSEQLASLNLRDGGNKITFTFVTTVWGKQQVRARIYLWKWNTRVVITDVDGTITKSDVLGQVMPLVGKDWTQSGAAKLFSAIKNNGYEIIFLSARAISQAHLTRQFLDNVKQDGEVLPDGPMILSSDGLFPSLYREVIRRAPHEFKIVCLESIKSLFPPDSKPFYAGFGNRDTDELSYLKVGVQKGKIFTINPKGDIIVNNRVDVKTYTSLHDFIHEMFPSMRNFVQEDYNDFNFWKLPLPDVEDDVSVSSPKPSVAKKVVKAGKRS